MTQREFQGWAAYYRNYPFDDLNRFHRPASIIAASNGMKIQEAIDYLQPEPLPEGMTMADVNTMRAFGINPNAME